LLDAWAAERKPLAQPAAMVVSSQAGRSRHVRKCPGGARLKRRHTLMSKLVGRVELITGHERRRRCSAEGKVWLVEEARQPGMTVSAVARLHGVSPSLPFGWRRSGRRTTWSPQAASASWRPRSGPWSACSAARLWRSRSFARRSTPPGEKVRLAAIVAASDWFPMKAVADTLGVARSNLVEQLKGPGTLPRSLPARGQRCAPGRDASHHRYTAHRRLPSGCGPPEPGKAGQPRGHGLSRRSRWRHPRRDDLGHDAGLRRGPVW
jgi:hypothetical protein